MISEICPGIFKISADSNIYILKKRSIVIDCGNYVSRDQIIKEFNQVENPLNVKTVIFTHLHYDHIANFDIFPNAEFYASADAIEDFHKDPFGTILNNLIVEKFKVDLRPLKNIDDFDVIKSPGHTSGSVCLYYKPKKILFSGDTLFFNEIIGRTDLPTSVPDKMEKTLKEIRKIDFDILCPGHDY